MGISSDDTSSHLYKQQMESNREWLKQQENFSQQLRQQSNPNMEHWIKNQIQNNPLAQQDKSFIEELAEKQHQSLSNKPSESEGALYFVSFSIVEEGLKRMLHETQQYSIPATLRGMVNNDMKSTINAVTSLVQNGVTDGIQIDPTLFTQYGITSVPALVVHCQNGFDVIRGNIQIKQALEKIAEQGDCAPAAQALLEKRIVK
ncbi:type-F conjugative transfer system pilin assembly protein TrbC [Xenorhabdus sp. XENO-1]|uniref:type-F conjugative transfer system pilin assembly protein TrbC n=1 Tax=Xenorhabdus bovienii TaxID=40576 RepID=UPI0020CA9B35|nr:type-F conjugative transfer system pilin assembly protein TrbC [Xenorhabdus bovienii]MCP9269148.1 type-F conjugative transfer system pilin assembly protein TrbC [Xenorhabdus bovienii subsp. africana]